MAFTPRLTAPSTSDPRWLQINYGGYNQCIVGSDGPPSVLPNCTGYVHGRWMEIAGVTTDNLGLSFGDAVEYYTNSDVSLIRSQNPSLGAVICYYQNDSYNQHPGHVAIVEQVIDNDTIVVSESNYGGLRFDTLTCYRATGWRPSTGWNVSPLGFIENPYVTPTPPPPPPFSGRQHLPLWMQLMAIRRGDILYRKVKNRRR